MVHLCSACGIGVHYLQVSPIHFFAMTPSGVLPNQRLLAVQPVQISLLLELHA